MKIRKEKETKEVEEQKKDAQKSSEALLTEAKESLSAFIKMTKKVYEWHKVC